MTEPELFPSYCTKDQMWCAIPYGNKQYIILHNGEQVHLSRSFNTAKKFIDNQIGKK